MPPNCNEETQIWDSIESPGEKGDHLIHSLLNCCFNVL